MHRSYALIAAGGTGGHMFPAQALAEVLLSRGWRVALATDARGLRYAGGFSEAVTRIEMRAATTARGGLLAKLMVPLILLGGLIGAILRLRRDRPAVVVGFGGYPAFPAMAAAWLLGIPRVIHEQNGVLGRVNALFASRVDLVACGVWPTALPKGAKGEFIGNPVRGRIKAMAGAPYVAPAAENALLIIGGSQGASIFARVVPAAIALLDARWREGLMISQQARAEDIDTVEAAYAGLGLKAMVAPFIEDVPERMAAAQLVISRAGASSIADISTIGRPAILVPYGAATGDHQRANATGLVTAGAAVLIDEADLTPERLAAAISTILHDGAHAQTMSKAALALGRPAADQHLADRIEKIASRTQP